MTDKGNPWIQWEDEGLGLVDDAVFRNATLKIERMADRLFIGGIDTGEEAFAITLFVQDGVLRLRCEREGT